jgi:hypothetical protein
VRVVVLLTPLYVAVSVTVVQYATVLVVTVKVAVLLPAAIVTDVGTLVEASLLVNDTEMPPVGATPLKVTVPVADVKLATLVGLTLRDDRATVAAGVMVSAAVLLTLL